MTLKKNAEYKDIQTAEVRKAFRLLIINKTCGPDFKEMCGSLSTYVYSFIQQEPIFHLYGKQQKSFLSPRNPTKQNNYTKILFCEIF